jgi:hypothetical protein
MVTTTVTTTSDGAQSTSSGFGGWFDMLRNEPCSFTAAADGTTRCMPVATADYSGGSYFQDAACTQQLAMTYKGTPACSPSTTPPAPKYITVSATVGGCSTTTLHPIGAKISPPPVTVYVKSTTCVGTPANAVYEFYTTPGPELLPSAFVQTTTTTTTQ